jgi:ABC-type metal ion transport system substrate-binding protein
MGKKSKANKEEEAKKILLEAEKKRQARVMKRIEGVLEEEGYDLKIFTNPVFRLVPRGPIQEG